MDEIALQEKCELIWAATYMAATFAGHHADLCLNKANSAVDDFKATFYPEAE